MRVFATVAAIIGLIVPSASLAAPVMMAPVSPVAMADKAAKKLPAPSAERLVLSRRVMAASGGSVGYNAMFDALLAGLLEGVRPGPQVMIVAAPYQERLVKSVHSHMPAMIEATAIGWARAFTEDELRDQATYLESPVSQGLIAKVPSLFHDLGVELGWFARQLALTDPKTAQYLADVKGGEEPPPKWATPPQESMDYIRARLAETPGGDALLHPDTLMDKMEKSPAGSKAKGKAKNAPPSAMEKRVEALLPQLINDLMVIVANHVTPEEFASQHAFAQSPGGKSMALKLKTMDKSFGDELLPIFKEIGHDVMTPPQTV